MGRISTSPRYVIDITEQDPFSLRELGPNSVIWKKSEKMRDFNFRTGYWVLMKFEFWKNIMSQSSYFKSRPDLVKEKFGEGRNLKS